MSFPESRVLSTKQLVQQIMESNRNGERFCFILGSGASVESGIPSGSTLEMCWMNCIMGEKEDRGTPAMDTSLIRDYKDAYLNRAKAYRAIGQDELAESDEMVAAAL